MGTLNTKKEDPKSRHFADIVAYRGYVRTVKVSRRVYWIMGKLHCMTKMKVLS